MKETIARTFRITEETAEKLKEICADFGNQNAALESLISAYEIQAAGTALTDRQTDIEDYSAHLQALQAAFLHSLEITEHTESRVRQEFQKLLDSKDSTIIELQERIVQLTAQAAAADERANAAELNAAAEITAQSETVTGLQEQLAAAEQKAAEQAETVTACKERIADKEKIIAGLQANADSIPALTARAETAEAAKETACTALKAAQQELESLKQQLDRERQQAEQAAALAAERAEIALQKAVFAEKSAALEKMQQLYESNSELQRQLAFLQKQTATGNSLK